MIAVKNFLDLEIYPNLNKADAVKGLDPEDRGSYYLVTCPKCGKREAYVSKTGLYIKCHRINKCGHFQSLWDYIQSTKSLTNEGTLRELARLAGRSLPELIDSYDELNHTANSDILETALNFFKAQLWSNKADDVLCYLRNAGFTDDEIRAVELGYYSSQAETEAFFVDKGYFINAVYGMGFRTTGFGETHRLVIPFRDPAGHLLGFIAGAAGSAAIPRYILSSGIPPKALFNLNRIFSDDSLVLVRDFLFALAAKARGLGSIVALGDDLLTEEQLTLAIQYGARSLVFALDENDAAPDSIRESLNLVHDHGCNTFVSFIPRGFSDFRDLISKNGVTAFRQALSSTQPAAEWKRESREFGTKTDREEVLKTSGLSGAVSSKSSTDGLRNSRFSPEGWNSAPDGARREIPGSFSEKSSVSARDGIESVFDGRNVPQPPELEPYSLESLCRDLSREEESITTGYRSLDSIISLPQGALTIIAGRPSHGMTTLMINLTLSMIKLSPRKPFLFFSHAECKRDIGLRFLNTMCGEILDESDNLGALGSYLASNDTGIPGIEEGKREFAELTEGKRLWIADAPCDMEGILHAITRMAEAYDIGAIFIDYLQRLKMRDNYGTREAEILDITSALARTARDLSVPIILGMRIGIQGDRKAETKERTVRLGNLLDADSDAHLIIGLWNESVKNEKETGRVSRTRTTDLELLILKNKNGPANNEIVLSLDRPVLRIKDKKRVTHIAGVI
ncbi:MAG: DnaB-like helicase C-terminal domain-containing protein [Pseudomonadota bacterium]